MSLGRWPGSLGQGLYDCVPLAREGVLGDALSTFSGAVGSPRENGIRSNQDGSLTTVRVIDSY